MPLEKKPFRKYNLDEDDKKFRVISLKLNKDEQDQLAVDKKIINQTKDGTAIKQLMMIGSEVIHDKKIAAYIKIVLDNKRRNKRLGIVDFD
jgi:urease gamma subunit